MNAHLFAKMSAARLVELGGERPIHSIHIGPMSIFSVKGTGWRVLQTLETMRSAL